MITRPRRERFGGGTSVVGPQGGGGYWAGRPGVHCWAGRLPGASAPVCCCGEFHPGGAGGVGMAGGADIGDGRGNVIAAVSAAFGPSGSVAAGGNRPGGSGPGDSVACGSGRAVAGRRCGPGVPGGRIGGRLRAGGGGAAAGRRGGRSAGGG